MSLGIGICQVVALATSNQSSGHSTQDDGQIGEIETAGLLKGYQASFWTMFAFAVTCVFIAIGGLRKTGKVGVKRD